MYNAKRILVPVDFSSESELALDWAVRIAQGEPDALIQLCHVYPGVFAPVGPEALGFDYAAFEAAERKSLEAKMRRLQRRVPKEIFTACSLVKGAIAEEIRRLCEKKVIDLVVMTTHGRRGLSRLLHGSTTEETARLAPCPVLVLHLNKKTQEAVKAEYAGQRS